MPWHRRSKSYNKYIIAVPWVGQYGEILPAQSCNNIILADTPLEYPRSFVLGGKNNLQGGKGKGIRGEKEKKTGGKTEGEKRKKWKGKKKRKKKKEENHGEREN